MTAVPNHPSSTPASPRQAGLAHSTVLGYPRVGPQRELKRALESYWDGESTPEDLLLAGRRLRESTWQRLDALGLAALPSNTFSLYDHVLDTALMLDAVPERYRASGPGGSLDVYFAMARGTAAVAPLRMTKWFDTNYHYIVPEIGVSTAFRLANDKPVAEVREARVLGLETRPVLLGPVTFLLLSQAEEGSPAAFSPLDRLDDVLDVYAELLTELAAEGVGWVQLDEPALVADRTDEELAAVRTAYDRLGGLTDRPRLFVASYFGDLDDALPVLAASPVEAIGIDLVRGRSVLTRPDQSVLTGKTLVAGVVSGRDVWRTEYQDALEILRTLRDRVGELVVSTSCSLLHVPHDLDLETDLDPALRERLAFADQKVAEVVALADLLADTADGNGPGAVQVTSQAEGGVTVPARSGTEDRPTAAAGASAHPSGRSPYAVRAAAQAEHLHLPALPVTTIGSFPQTGELRAARAAVAAGHIDQEQYEKLITAEIERAIRLHR